MSSEHARTCAAVAALAAVAGLGLLAGCPTGGSSGAGGECNLDVECDDGDVCARDQACTPAVIVREVITRWTVGGQPASAATCASYAGLAITFVGSGFDDVIGFAPVPCALGQFAIDKLPSRFSQVGLGTEGGTPPLWAIPATNTVTIDLP